jgi:hypothetical protein
VFRNGMQRAGQPHEDLRSDNEVNFYAWPVICCKLNCLFAGGLPFGNSWSKCKDQNFIYLDL